MNALQLSRRVSDGPDCPAWVFTRCPGTLWILDGATITQAAPWGHQPIIPIVARWSRMFHPPSTLKSERYARMKN